MDYWASSQFPVACSLLKKRAIFSLGEADIFNNDFSSWRVYPFYSYMKFSLILSTKGRTEEIARVFMGFRDQTLQDFEIIVLDNKSTDNTVNVVAAYTDPRIKLFKNDENIGMLGNWNKVMTLATGDYIKVLPADDSIYPECLKLQSSILDQDLKKVISLVCGRKDIINDDGKILFTRGFARRNMNVNGIKAINKTIRSAGNVIGEPGAVMFRREILKKTGVFEGGIYLTIDLGLWFRMLLHGMFKVLLRS